MRKFVNLDNSHIIVFYDDNDKAIKQYEENKDYTEIFELW